MKKVVFFCMADHAGSAYEAVQAINRVGRVHATHVTLQIHPHGFKYGIRMNSTSQQGRGVVSEQPQYQQVCDLLEDADYIHTWNDLYEHYNHCYKNDQYKSFWGHFPQHPHKVRSTTMTGSWYRIHTDLIDDSLKKHDRQLIVQTPAFLEEKDLTAVGGKILIPHAIDVLKQRVTPHRNKLVGSIGCYHHNNTTGTQDIELLEEIIARKFPHLQIPELMNRPRKRLHQREYRDLLSRCMFFMQHTDTNRISYGRSAVEAMTFGVPVLNSLCWQAKKVWPNIPIFDISPETLEQVLTDVLAMDYDKISNAARQFAEDVHSYEVVGEQYTALFEGF